MAVNQERDALIRELRFNKRLTERAIAAKVGMSPAGVHQAVRRLSGKRRDQSRKEECEGCREPMPVSWLRDGQCADCRGGAE